jgi:hypothetical protein
MGCEDWYDTQEQRKHCDQDREGDTHRSRRPTGSSSEPMTSKAERSASALTRPRHPMHDGALLR